MTPGLRSCKSNRMPHQEVRGNFTFLLHESDTNEEETLKRFDTFRITETLLLEDKVSSSSLSAKYKYIS